MLCVFVAKQSEQFRLHEVSRQAIEDSLFQPVAADGPVIAARSLVPGIRASGAGRVQIDHSSPAYPAGHQSREQMTRAFTIPESFRVPVSLLLVLARLHGLPEIVRNDPELRYVLDDPFLVGIEA